ncbi:MAG: serine protease, partial [Acidobacteria bacterium]
TIPSSASGAFSFWLNVTSSETTTSRQYDKLYVEIRSTSGSLKKRLATYSNLNKAAAGVYSQKSFSLSAYKGQTVRVQFRVTNDSSLPTTFRVDDVSLQ